MELLGASKKMVLLKSRASEGTGSPIRYFESICVGFLDWTKGAADAVHNALQCREGGLARCMD